MPTKSYSVRCPLSGGPALLVSRIPVARVLEAYQRIERSIGPLGIERFFSNVDCVDIYRSEATGYEFYYPFDLAGDEELYRRLSTIPWYYTEDKWEYDAALPAVNDSDWLLELGCGRGAFLRKVAGRAARAVGLELNQEAASYCQESGLEVWNRSIEDVASEFPEGFDVVVSFQLIEHIADPRPLLEAACRSLCVGGTLVLSVPNNDSDFFDELDPLNAPPHHMGLWNARALLWLERALPLRAIDVRCEPAYKSRRARIVRRMLGENGMALLASPWAWAALGLVPGHTIQVSYERQAGGAAMGRSA